MVCVCVCVCVCVYELKPSLSLDISLQYFGGTNFGRTAGGPLIATSYDYDAPIDEYGKYSNKNKT